MGEETTIGGRILDNQNGTNPEGGGALLTGAESAEVADPTSQMDESGHEGSVQTANAPEPPKWVHQLNGELKANELVAKHQNINDLVAEYVQFAGKAERMVELPGDDAEPEARLAYYEKVRPKTPEDYELTLPDIPDEVALSKDEDTEYRKAAFEAGLTKEQAREMHMFSVSREIKEQVEILNEEKAALDTLKKEWGDNFTGNINGVQRAFKVIAERIGDAKLAERMVESGIGNNADVLKLFHGVWQSIKPDNFVEGDIDSGGRGVKAEDWYPETDFNA